MLLVQYIIQDKKSTEQFECLFCVFSLLHFVMAHLLYRFVVRITT